MLLIDMRRHGDHQMLQFANLKLLNAPNHLGREILTPRFIKSPPIYQPSIQTRHRALVAFVHTRLHICLTPKAAKMQERASIEIV
eukprot:6219880-Amphidinium_carterae.1